MKVIQPLLERNSNLINGLNNQNPRDINDSIYESNDSISKNIKDYLFTLILQEMNHDRYEQFWSMIKDNLTSQENLNFKSVNMIKFMEEINHERRIYKGMVGDLLKRLKEYENIVFDLKRENNSLRLNKDIVVYTRNNMEKMISSLKQTLFDLIWENPKYKNIVDTNQNLLSFMKDLYDKGNILKDDQYSNELLALFNVVPNIKIPIKEIPTESHEISQEHDIKDNQKSHFVTLSDANDILKKTEDKNGTRLTQKRSLSNAKNTNYYKDLENSNKYLINSSQKKLTKQSSLVFKSSIGCSKDLDLKYNKMNKLCSPTNFLSLKTGIIPKSNDCKINSLKNKGSGILDNNNARISNMINGFLSGCKSKRRRDNSKSSNKENYYETDKKNNNDYLKSTFNNVYLTSENTTTTSTEPSQHFKPFCTLQSVDKPYFDQLDLMKSITLDNEYFEQRNNTTLQERQKNQQQSSKPSVIDSLDEAQGVYLKLPGKNVDFECSFGSFNNESKEPIALKEKSFEESIIYAIDGSNQAFSLQMEGNILDEISMNKNHDLMMNLPGNTAVNLPLNGKNEFQDMEKISFIKKNQVDLTLSDLEQVSTSTITPTSLKIQTNRSNVNFFTESELIKVEIPSPSFGRSPISAEESSYIFNKTKEIENTSLETHPKSLEELRISSTSLVNFNSSSNSSKKNSAPISSTVSTLINKMKSNYKNIQPVLKKKTTQIKKKESMKSSKY